MPRDNNGTYSLPNGTLVNSGDTILVSQHNPPFQDMATAITGSLARNGVGGMLAPLQMNGYPVRDIADGALPTDAATVRQTQANGTPIGSVVMWVGDSAPMGWLFCTGQEVSRSEYAELFALIGVKYGPGNAATTFNVPDFRGRGPIGRDVERGGAYADRIPTSLLNTRTAGNSGGVAEVTLTDDQMPKHTHTASGTIPNHNHQWVSTSGSGQAIDTTGNTPASRSFNAAGSSVSLTGDPLTGTYYTGTPNNVSGTQAVTITVGETGSDEAHPNVQPSLVCDFIIKAKVN